MNTNRATWIALVRNGLFLGMIGLSLALAACSSDSSPTTDGDETTTDGDTSVDGDMAVDGDTDTEADTTEASTDSTVGDRTDYSSISLASKATYSSGDTGVTVENAEYTSTAADTPAIKVASGGGMTLAHVKATKSGGGTASNDNSNFYGMNAGVLVSSSGSASNYASSKAASISMSDCTVTTSAEGANGVFAFGEGATATLDHVTIATTADSSRGVDATYGGTVTITNSVIDTRGAHCAALASDRYNGASAPKINATNVVGTTAGEGSPGIYCTGTFNVANSKLTATGSEAAAIEGLNSITLTDTAITGNTKWGRDHLPEHVGRFQRGNRQLQHDRRHLDQHLRQWPHVLRLRYRRGHHAQRRDARQQLRYPASRQQCRESRQLRHRQRQYGLG